MKTLVACIALSAFSIALSTPASAGKPMPPDVKMFADKLRGAPNFLTVEEFYKQCDQAQTPNQDICFSYIAGLIDTIQMMAVWYDVPDMRLCMEGQSIAVIRQRVKTVLEGFIANIEYGPDFPAAAAIYTDFIRGYECPKANKK